MTTKNKFGIEIMDEATAAAILANKNASKASKGNQMSAERKSIIALFTDLPDNQMMKLPVPAGDTQFTYTKKIRLLFTNKEIKHRTFITPPDDTTYIIVQKLPKSTLPTIE
jgi:hypothetical protein